MADIGDLCKVRGIIVGGEPGFHYVEITVSGRTQDRLRLRIPEDEVEEWDES